MASARSTPKSINDLISSSGNFGRGVVGVPCEIGRLSEDVGADPSVLPGPAKLLCEIGACCWGGGSSMAPVDESMWAPEGVGTMV
jgi:hypothetical protein